MRSVKEYLTNAGYFETLAARATDAALKKRFADMAECYRLLAAERERLSAAGTIPPEKEP
jgi:hypothetical protein